MIQAAKKLSTIVRLAEEIGVMSTTESDPADTSSVCVRERWNCCLLAGGLIQTSVSGRTSWLANIAYPRLGLPLFRFTVYLAKEFPTSTRTQTRMSMPSADVLLVFAGAGKLRRAGSRTLSVMT